MIRRSLVFACFLLGLFFSLQAALPEIHFTIPSDETEYSVTTSPHRFAGYSLYADSLTMNGEPLKIFPTGAFAGRFQLEEGENEFIFQAHNNQGTVTRTVTVEYSRTRYEYPEDVLYISERGMSPGHNLILTVGDRLEVQCRATPGSEVQFRIEGLTGYIPMQEVPDRKGIYQGAYVIREDDLVKDAEVQFRLSRGLFRSIKASAPGQVSISEQFPCSAVITSDLADIRAGLAGARLGGARLFHGQEGQHIIVTGKVSNQYRIALTSNLDGWIHEDNVELFHPGQEFPHNFIGSYIIGKDDISDYISVPLQYRVPFYIYDKDNTLYVDIYYSTSNTTWVTDRLQAEIIEKVSWHQVENNLYRLQVDLKDRLWGYYGEYDGNRLRIGVKKAPEMHSNREQYLQGLTIVLDPGHHGPGRDSGAIGSLGTREKDVNLALAELLQKELKKAGTNVIMTREGDATVTWDERRSTILNHEADIWISIHANSIGWGSNPLAILGTSTYYRHPFNHRFSELVLKRLLDTGLDNFGNISSFNFSPLQFTHCPTLLVEAAFMSHPEDEEKLIDPAWQLKIVQAVVEGIKDFLEDYISEK